MGLMKYFIVIQLQSDSAQVLNFLPHKSYMGHERVNIQRIVRLLQDAKL